MAADLGALLAGYVQQGLCTHASASLGQLLGTTDRLQAELLPDGARVFDLASLTKALVTTPLMFFWHSRLGLSLTAPLTKYLGANTLGLDHRLLQLTPASLLSHRSGLPAWRNLWICRLGPNLIAHDHSQHLVAALNRAADQLQPAAGPVYSDLGFLLLGLLLEAVGKKPLDELFRDLLRSELGLDPDQLDLGFPRSSAHLKDFITTGMCLVRGHPLHGEVHDENCAALGGVCAHAGLFGSGPALGRLLRALAQSALGQELLRANAALRQWPQGAAEPPGFLLGWRQGHGTARGFGDGAAIGHLGFTGTAFWLWPETGEYATLLTNRVVSGRVSSSSGIAAMRRDVFTALGSA